MRKQIAVITDMAFMGSGYYYIFTNLAKGLVQKGHKITVAGLSYMGEPHSFPFSIIPSPNLQDAVNIINNLVFLKKVDLILVALDIPLQMVLQQQFAALLHPDTKKKIPYMAITPMENGPLVDEWAIGLTQLDWIWMISEMAEKEARLAGVTKVGHLQVGVDTELWHRPTEQERKQLRQGLGFEEDDFVILTVADNQERKNLWAGMRIVAQVAKNLSGRNVRYMVVTREDSQVGWRLRSLAKSEGILKEFIPFQRGMPTHDLWGLFACADVYLQPSKAEGLGLPLMEAMGCGVPVVCTATGAMTELCANDRGFLVPVAYSFIDVWGNSKRDMIDISAGAYQLELLSGSLSDMQQQRVSDALAYVKARTWDIPVQQVDDKIREMFDEPKQAQKEG